MKTAEEVVSEVLHLQKALTPTTHLLRWWMMHFLKREHPKKEQTGVLLPGRKP